MSDRLLRGREFRHLAGAITRSGSWLMALGVPLRPNADALRAEWTPGECLMCGAVVERRDKRGPAPEICGQRRKTPCQMAYYSVANVDRAYRGGRVYWAVLGVLSTLMQLGVLSRPAKQARRHAHRTSGGRLPPPAWHPWRRAQTVAYRGPHEAHP